MSAAVATTGTEGRKAPGVNHPRSTRLYVCGHDKEIEKPDGGGGHGPEALYAITGSIDGRPALRLMRHHFAQTGQMHAFLEEMEKFSARDVGATVKGGRR